MGKYFTKEATPHVLRSAFVPGGFMLDRNVIRKWISRGVKDGSTTTTEVARGLKGFLSAFSGGKEVPSLGSIGRRGLIAVGDTSATGVKFMDSQNVPRHELTHYLRSKKGKWSARKYGDNPLATVIEETAAHRKGGAGPVRALQGGLWTAASRSSNKAVLALGKVLEKV